MGIHPFHLIVLCPTIQAKLQNKNDLSERVGGKVREGPYSSLKNRGSELYLSLYFGKCDWGVGETSKVAQFPFYLEILFFEIFPYIKCIYQKKITLKSYKAQLQHCVYTVNIQASNEQLPFFFFVTLFLLPQNARSFSLTQNVL